MTEIDQIVLEKKTATIEIRGFEKNKFTFYKSVTSNERRYFNEQKLL